MNKGSSLNDKELLAAAFKQAVVREKHRHAKFLALAENLDDKRLKNMFFDFAAACEHHLNLLANEMDALNVK